VHIDRAVNYSADCKHVPMRLIKSIFALMFSMTLSACDVFLDAAIDCLDGDRPQYNRSVLPEPILNQAYRQVIQASIKNEPYDDRFVYDFTLSGSLPTGLVTEIVNREVLIIGTPVELGTFTLGLFVEVRLPSSGPFNQTDSGLCSSKRGRNFELTVQAM
jgi:hypothetical protein